MTSISLAFLEAAITTFEQIRPHLPSWLMELESPRRFALELRDLKVDCEQHPTHAIRLAKVENVARSLQFFASHVPGAERGDSYQEFIHILSETQYFVAPRRGDSIVAKFHGNCYGGFVLDEEREQSWTIVTLEMDEDYPGDKQGRDRNTILWINSSQVHKVIEEEGSSQKEGE